MDQQHPAHRKRYSLEVFKERRSLRRFLLVVTKHQLTEFWATAFCLSNVKCHRSKTVIKWKNKPVVSLFRQIRPVFIGLSKKTFVFFPCWLNYKFNYFMERDIRPLC